MNEGLFGIPIIGLLPSDRVRRRKPFNIADTALHSKSALRLGLTGPSIESYVGTTSFSSTASLTYRDGVATNGSIIVIVGVDSSGAASNVCKTSPDGITWTSRTMFSTKTWAHVVWTGTRFLAAAASADNGTNVSTDGITWVAGPNLPTTTARMLVMFKNVLYVFDQGSTTTYWSSVDEGATWVPRSYPTTVTAQSPASSVSVNAVTMTMYWTTGAVAPYYTTDGINWTLSTSLAARFGSGARVSIRSDGVGVALINTASTRGIRAARTTDYGMSWSEMGSIHPRSTTYIKGSGSASANRFGQSLSASAPTTASIAPEGVFISHVYNMPVYLKGGRFVALALGEVDASNGTTAITATYVFVLHSGDGVNWEFESPLWQGSNSDPIVPLWHDASADWNLICRVGAETTTFNHKLNPDFEELIYDYTL